MPGFYPATRAAAKARIAIDGPSGSGKTLTALRFAMQLGDNVAVIDSEHGRASLYVGMEFDGKKIAFASCLLDTFSPAEYVRWISAAAGTFDVLVVDSLSHAWSGAGGALELVDNSNDKNKFAAWKDVTPLHRRMIESLIGFPGHVVCTMRSKTDYVLTTNAKGKMEPQKIGMAPVQRSDMEYEFDLYCSMDMDHELRVMKVNGAPLDGVRSHKPGAEFMKPYIEWLRTGVVSSNGAVRVAMATDGQVASLQQIVIELDMGQRASRAELMRRYTVEQYHQLTEDQAAELMRLWRIRMEDKGKTSPATSVPPSDAVAERPAASTGAGEAQTLQEALADQAAADAALTQAAKPTGLATQEQLANLISTRESYFSLLGWGDAAACLTHRNERWVAILAQWGVKSATALTVDQANEMLGRLEAKVQHMTSEHQAVAQAARQKESPPAATPEAAPKS